MEDDEPQARETLPALDIEDVEDAVVDHARFPARRRLRRGSSTAAEEQAPSGTAVFRAAEPAAKREPREPPQLTTIEAVFATWGKNAVWSDDITEVALWNDRDKAYSDFYEVRRYGGAYYFRTIPR